MNRIKQLRESKSLSLQDLQNELLEEYGVNISRSSLNNYERGEQEPKKEVWEFLANFFKVDIQYIMGLSPVRNKVENFFYEDGIQRLVDLVDENSENSPLIRNILVSMSHLAFKNSKDSIGLNKIQTILHILNLFSSPDTDSIELNSQGETRTKKEMIKLILKNKNEYEQALNYFIDNTLDKLYEPLTIKVNLDDNYDIEDNTLIIDDEHEINVILKEVNKIRNNFKDE